MLHKKQKAIRSNKKCYLRPNDRFGFIYLHWRGAFGVGRFDNQGVTENSFHALTQIFPLLP